MGQKGETIMKTLALIASVVMGLLGSLGSPAQAQLGKEIAIDIPSQPLGEALAELAKQTGLQVVLYSAVGKQTTTARLAGKFTAQAALERLLVETGLRYEYLDQDTVAVLKEGESLAAEGSAN